MKKRVKTKKNLWATALGIVWGAIIAGYVNFAFSLFADDSLSYTNSPIGLIYDIQRQEYGNMHSAAIGKLANGANRDENSINSEVYAINDYIEASFMYKIYKESGNAAAMERCEQVIDDSKEKIGDLSFVLDEIDAKLNK